MTEGSAARLAGAVLILLVEPRYVAGLGLIKPPLDRFGMGSMCKVILL